MPIEERITAALSIDPSLAFEPGQPLEIETLVRAYYPDVLRLAGSFIHDEHTADDLAQETFIAAARSLETFRGDSKVKTWLFGITINLCRAHLRKQRRRDNLLRALQAVTHLHPRAPGPEDSAVQHETSSQLRAAVEGLDEKHRIPVILFYVHDLSVPEIARTLGTTAGTIYSRLHYARKQLRHLIRLE